MDRDDLMWLAGLIEGEGCFQPGPKGRPNKCTITVQMTDEDVIERVASLFGTKHFAQKSKQKAHHKTSYIARANNSRAKELMLMLRPLMGQRRQQQIDRALQDVGETWQRTSVEEISKFREMYDSGIPVREIVTMTGRPRRTIYKYLDLKSRIPTEQS